MNSIESLGQLSIRPIVEQCRDVLAAHYGEQLNSLVLYGSAARQEMTEESDIDLLVVLEEPLDYFRELRMIVDLIYPLQMVSSHWISAGPAAVNEFESGAIQLYRNALEEGVTV
ncbi:MAG: nucleotidyltransferase domain-containing protein [Cyanobacteria bacterium J06627_28]